MKLLHGICTLSLLLLTACATKPNITPSTNANTSSSFPGLSTTLTLPPARSTANAPRTGSYPNGRLSELTPGSAQFGNKSAVAELTPPADLWERIRRGYGIANLDGDLVRDREQWYTTRPDYIVRMTDRGSKYLFHVVEELELRNMPTELALLPFIESAFNPQAMSSAKAAGMWQFVPSTGKYFALKQTMFRDDRRDVLASTRAALDYLNKLYGMFGDWQLALAAYNWGEGSVQRAIAKNQKAGLPTGYSDLNMPMETRMYIPKLQAVKNIVANPEMLGVRLPHIGNHPYFQQVPITRDIDVTLAAKLADIRIEDFKALNPSANRPVILASGTPQILLPWDNATTFQQNLEAYSDARLATWTAWIAPSTMKAADAAHRVGMSETDFRAINNIPPRMLVKAGSTLLVPRGNSRQADVSLQVADNAQLSLAPEIVLKKTSVKARKHETVASLAKRYNVSASSVAEWNKISAGAAFKAGQHVVVFLPVQARVHMARGGDRGGKNVKTANAGHNTGRNTSHSKTNKPERGGKVRIAKR